VPGVFGGLSVFRNLYTLKMRMNGRDKDGILRGVCLFLAMAWPVGYASAQEISKPLQTKGAYNLSINYPGAALRYFVADGKGLELLAQSQSGVLVGGLRYYRYPARLRGVSLNPYWAVEGDYLSFKGDVSKGKGWGCGLYAGAEYRLGRRLAVQTEFGAMHVSLTDKSTDLSESGLEFLINLGINFYFGGRP